MDEEFLIHPERLSAKLQSFQGAFTPAELERLEDSIADGRGELRYLVTAGLDSQRRKSVSCIIEGFVFLMCQKSLEAFRHEISIRERLILVDHEAQLPPLEDEGEEDYVVADGPVDIRDLVEDAVLLSLPMVPRKPDTASAAAKAGVAEAGAGGPAASRDGTPVKGSPFAALASLRKK